MNNCFICGGNLNLFFSYYNKIFNRKFEYWRCDECSHTILKPKLSNKVLFNQYIYDGNTRSKNVSLQKIVDVFFESKIYAFFFSGKKFLQKANHLYKILNKISPTNYLDYGSGNSKSAQYFKEIVPTSICECFEKSSMARKIDGIFLHKTETSLIKGKKRYDVISLFHVLEHIQDLQLFFKILNQITTNKSIVIFQIPQANSIDIILTPYLKHHFVLHNPYHLNFFSEKSLTTFLNHHKYEVLKVDFEIYQVNSLIENQNILIKFLLTPIMILFSLICKFLKISNVMTVYARKE